MALNSSSKLHIAPRGNEWAKRVLKCGKIRLQVAHMTYDMSSILWCHVLLHTVTLRVMASKKWFHLGGLLECRVVAISNITIICRDIDHSYSQSKKNKATICCCLCFDDGREMSNPMTSSEQKETLGLRYGLFQRSVVTHHFLFSGWNCQNQRSSKASKGKIFSQVTIYHRFYFGSNLIPSSPPIKPHP